MEKLNKFTFYYTLFAVSVLLIGSVFFQPKPFNLIQPLVLAPSFFLLWLKVTDPEGATESGWSMHLVIVLFIVTALAIIGYSQFSDAKGKIEALNEEKLALEESGDVQAASISAELANLRDELMKIKENETDVIGAASGSANTNEILDLLNSLGTPKPSPTPTPTPAPVIAGKIRVKGTNPVNVYQSNDSSSKIVGVADPAFTYDYTESAGPWYEISLTESSSGWIEASKVIEVN